MDKERIRYGTPIRKKPCAVPPLDSINRVIISSVSSGVNRDRNRGRRALPGKGHKRISSGNSGGSQSDKQDEISLTETLMNTFFTLKRTVIYYLLLSLQVFFRVYQKLHRSTDHFSSTLYYIKIKFTDQNPVENMSVTLHTDVGDIKIELFCEQCPKACENFLALCASDYYNGCLFHRNIKVRKEDLSTIIIVPITNILNNNAA